MVSDDKGRCNGALNIAGENYQCVEPVRHGGSCRNPEVEAVWISNEAANEWADKHRVNALIVQRDAAIADRDRWREDAQELCRRIADHERTGW